MPSRTGSQLLTLAVLVSSLATTHCSKDGAESRAADAASPSTPSTPSRTASCDRVPAMSVCSEYSGGYLAQNEAVLSSGCGKLGGTFVAAGCPNTAVLGKCELSTTEVRTFYASGAAAYDAARAQKECVGSYKGKWTVFN